ncbi:MAG: biotin--[acetyl-CoA-carboxylase] ligase [Phycisphaerales bacterium]
MSVPAPSKDLSSWADALEATIASSPAARMIDRVAVVRETASTQDAARSMGGGRPGLLLVAGRQTAGRGRLGRVWADAHDHSLAMTFVLDAARHDAGQVALASGLAACLAAEQAGARDAALKWPNDVVDRSTGRKLAGVLVEVADDLLLVGVGMNVSHTATDWPEPLRERAVSLAQLGANVTRLDAARLVLRSFETALALPLGRLADEWRRRDTLVGASHRFRHDGREYVGLVESIEPTSHIIVRTGDGEAVRLPAATTSLVLAD